MRGMRPEDASPGDGDSTELCGLFVARGRGSAREGGGGSYPEASDDAESSYSSSFKKHRRWHPDIGLTSFLWLLVFCAAVLLALWMHWFPRKLQLLEIRILTGESVSILVGTSCLQEYISLFHKQQLQRGYLRFNKRLGGLVPIPLMIASYCTAAALTVLVMLEGRAVFLALSLILALEIASLVSLVSLYFWYILMLRIGHEQPDAYEELASVCTLTSGESSYEDEEGLVERQATLLQFQLEKIQHLNHEILRLQEQLSKQSRFAGEEGTHQVESAQFFAIREQERQAMAAEREQLQAELLRAHGMLGEQQDECVRLRSTNQQYVDENARLRLILDEWSARNAKLEIALETQMALVNELQTRLKGGHGDAL